MKIKPDLAYLVGALRDGSVFYEKSSRNYIAVWYEEDKRWLKESISKRLNKLFGKPGWLLKYKQKHHRIRFSSKLVHNMLINEFDFISPQKYWSTPKIIKHANKDIIKNYIAGFFDAEGDISIKDKSLGFSQKNKESLKFIRNWLINNKIECSKIFIADKKSETNRFYISKINNLLIFRRLIPFEHPDKLHLLELLLQRT